MTVTRLFLATLALGLALALAAALPCAQRREISPCTCEHNDITLTITCERVNYQQVVNALANKFPPLTTAALSITHSDLHPLELPDAPPLSGLGLVITNVKLHHDNISSLEEPPFEGLTKTEFLSFADNELTHVPARVLTKMPNMKTLDLSRNNIKALRATDFADLPKLQHLLISGNDLTFMDSVTLPKILKNLHIGRNNLVHLNGTLKYLDDLEWLFINSNKLTNIDNQLSMNAKKMNLIHAADNELEHLPEELKHFLLIESLYFQNNKIKSLDGVLQKARKLERLNLSFNQLKHLNQDDFAEADAIKVLDLGHNNLQALNGSLTPIRMLKSLNLTHNNLTDFSLQEIRGLKELMVIDLSYNKITHLNGHTENLVEFETKLLELRLNHNFLHSLGGALMGLHGLLNLNVSHNLLEIISPDDLIGLDQLIILDVSHNQITTLEETSKTYLPALEKLFASNNNLTMLDKDFHGLPVLCYADLSNNQIEYINFDLVTKSKCSISGVLGTLKISIHDNPVVCGDHFGELIQFMEKFHTRFVGSCSDERYTEETPLGGGDIIAPTLLNDIIMPVNGGILLQSRLHNMLLLNNHLPQNPHSSKLLVSGKNIVGHLIPGRNGELPIIVDPPITLPPPTTSNNKLPDQVLFEYQVSTKINTSKPDSQTVAVHQALTQE